MPTTRSAKNILPALCCLLLSLTACSMNGETVRPSWENGVLRVGVTANYPSLIHKEAGSGRISGFEADCAALLAKRLHSSLQFVDLKWEEQIPALERKKVDIIMSAMSVTEMRKLQVAFSEPYLSINQMALTTIETKPKFPSVQEILATDKTIGVEKGTTGDLFVQRYCPKAEALYFSSPDDAVTALRDKRIVLFIHDDPVLRAYSKRTDDLVLLQIPLTSEELAWAVRRDNQSLLKEVNTALESWKEDGTIQSLLKKWLPQ